MDEPIIVPCPVCGAEDERAGIEKHTARPWGSNVAGEMLPAGESFMCIDTNCGFYVEVNRQGVLESMFKRMSGEH